MGKKEKKEVKGLTSDEVYMGGADASQMQNLSKQEQDMLQIHSDIAAISHELVVLSKYININMQIVLSIARACGVTPDVLAAKIIEAEENKKFNFQTNEFVKKYEGEIAEALKQAEEEEKKLNKRKEVIKRTTKNK